MKILPALEIPGEETSARVSREALRPVGWLSWGCVDESHRATPPEAYRGRPPPLDRPSQTILCAAYSESHSVVSNSLQPRGLYSPWNFPGHNTGVGSLSLHQGIFQTQGSNPGLLHCRQILYRLSHLEMSVVGAGAKSSFSSWTMSWLTGIIEVPTLWQQIVRESAFDKVSQLPIAT